MTDSKAEAPSHHRPAGLEAPSGELGVSALFQVQSAKSPSAIAIAWPDGEMTYAQLEASSNRLCRHLQRIGVGQGCRVGILMPRSQEAIVTMLAVLKAGGAFVPLDPSYPEEQTRFIVADSAPTVVVTMQNTLAALGSALPWSAQTFVLDDHASEVAAESSDPLEWATGGENPAYVMYTSGSTGQPKGVIVPHRAIVRLVCNCDFVHLGADETILQLAPLAFDASTFEIWGSLLNGGRLAILPGDQPTLDGIVTAIERHGVTTLWLTAGLFHVMVDHRLDGLRPLRQLLAGGDVLSPPHVRQVLEGLPGCRLINGYGPTENTTFTCCYTIPREGWGDGPVPIGTPISGTTVYVVDDDLRPVPDGEPGQLATGGAGVALGYLNRPDLTAERFVASPFGTDGHRLYLTGDIVRRRADGVLDFMGRVDRQVKINGKRVELDEIETVLRHCPQVQDGSVLMREDVPGRRRLAAYATPSREHLVPSTDMPAVIRDYLNSYLPCHMIPADIIVLDTLPLTANGKVDRANLPPPHIGLPMLDADALPRGEIERQLSEICRKVLGADAIGRTRNFFDLGATSLQIVAIHAEITRVLRVPVTLVDLFTHTNVADLARHLDGRPQNDADLSASQDRSRRGRDAVARLRRSRTELHT